MRDKDEACEYWKVRDRSRSVARRTIVHRARHQSEHEETQCRKQIAVRDARVNQIRRAEENKPGERHPCHVALDLRLHMNKKNPRPGYIHAAVSAIKKLKHRFRKKFTLRHPPKVQSQSASAESRY